MAKRNLTIQLDDEVMHKAKVIAANRGTSVSGLVTQQLERLVEADERRDPRCLRLGTFRPPRGTTAPPPLSSDQRIRASPW